MICNFSKLWLLVLLVQGFNAASLAQESSSDLDDVDVLFKGEASCQRPKNPCPPGMVLGRTIPNPSIAKPGIGPRYIDPIPSSNKCIYVRFPKQPTPPPVRHTPYLEITGTLFQAPIRSRALDRYEIKIRGHVNQILCNGKVSSDKTLKKLTIVVDGKAQFQAYPPRIQEISNLRSGDKIRAVVFDTSKPERKYIRAAGVGADYLAVEHE